MKKFISVILCVVLMLSIVGCTSAKADSTNLEKKEKTFDKKKEQIVNELVLDSRSAKLNGIDVESFDYTWHCDPSEAHTDVKNAPAEYYTGTKPKTDAAVYIDHELYYYPELPSDGFKQVRYDGENEYAYYYTDGENNEYIFATLPCFQGGRSLPSYMMHSEEEAATNCVLHIVKPGIYSISGSWRGQIKVDLGDDAYDNEDATVTIILNNVDVNCSVAPALIIENAYECDNAWKNRDEYNNDVDLSNVGVNVIIADDSENTLAGYNIYRMLKTQYKDSDSNDDVKVQKKVRKVDSPFYSYVSMTISGQTKNNGKLIVDSSFEGIGTELHLAFNGGNITIESQDDGINVNEDGVSVVYFNGSNLTINAAQGAEGDGVDSNGFIVINDGVVKVNGIRVPDSALDSDKGVTYNGGSVIIDGVEQNYKPGTEFKEDGRMGNQNEDMNDFFNRFNRNENSEFDIKSFKEKVAALPDDATFADVLAILGMNNPDIGNRNNWKRPMNGEEIQPFKRDKTKNDTSAVMEAAPMEPPLDAPIEPAGGPPIENKQLNSEAPAKISIFF